MLYQCTVQSPCRRARRRLLRRCRCLSLSLSLGYSRSRSRSRSRRRTRGQGRMHSTLRPSTHRPSSVASSITLPSCSSTAGSKIQAELGCCRLHRAPPVGPGQLDTGIGHSVTASQPAALKAADPNFVWPSREQEQQELQAQLAAAAVQQASKQLLQQAGKALMSTTRPIASPPLQPLTLHALPISVHHERPPIPARLKLRSIHRCVSFDPRDTTFMMPGPRCFWSAQQVRHVSSPQRVSQHEPEGPGSSGAEQGGAAGAPGMHVPSLWHNKHRAIRTARVRRVQSYLISYIPARSSCASAPISR